MEGHTDSVRSVAFSPDGGTLASGGGWQDNTIRLWDANTGEHKRTLEGHAGGVHSLAYSPDGGTLASGSEDGTILLWEVTPAMHAIDINQDGVINTQDLEWVASHFGQSDQDAADVNRDGIVNIFDLVLVAAAFGAGN
jgi:WD40 repeat protein